MDIHKTRIAALAMIKRLYFASLFIFGLFPSLLAISGPLQG
jgi:hypothetical protein